MDIRGVTVEFPHKPYDCQLVYMEKIIEALQTRSNALLESPTGTGAKNDQLVFVALGVVVHESFLRGTFLLLAHRNPDPHPYCSPSTSPYLPTYLPTYLPPSLPTCLPTCTETGKTLSILCAALAWQRSAAALSQLEDLRQKNPGVAKISLVHEGLQSAVDGEADSGGGRHSTSSSSSSSSSCTGGGGGGGGGGGSGPFNPLGIYGKAHRKTPLIIYASRTHSQLTQVVKELKTTVYRPKVGLLASRQQLCVHPLVSKITGAVCLCLFVRPSVHPCP